MIFIIALKKATEASIPTAHVYVRCTSGSAIRSRCNINICMITLQLILVLRNPQLWQGTRLADTNSKPPMQEGRVTVQQIPVLNHPAGRQGNHPTDTRSNPPMREDRVAIHQSPVLNHPIGWQGNRQAETRSIHSNGLADTNTVELHKPILFTKTNRLLMYSVFKMRTHVRTL